MGQSRNEDILESIIAGEEYSKVPQSREEQLLIDLKDAIEGSGGTTNYESLSNKPKINNVELNGNKSLDDIGVTSAIQTEVARIVADAPEDFDTLKEMSDWIATHEADAAAMNSAILQNASDISDLEDTKQDTLTTAQLAAVNSGVTAEKVAQYDDLVARFTIVYGFHVDPDESDPSDAVTYLMDAVGMEPAKMGTTAFNYGSWKNAFFMPKPCMLKYDGTVDYYLDPNDFTKKVNGTASDVGNINYAGNAMMEFPKIWFKFEAGTANGEGYFYVSNQKVDNSYKCWCNMDADGNEIDHFYVHIYNGVIYDDKMRSLSGKGLTPWSTTVYSSSATYAVNSIVNYDGKMWRCITAVETAEAFDSTKWEQFVFNGNTDGTQELNSATANNTTAKSEWYIDAWCDRVLITALLYLMGKSLNLQATFGRGIDSGSQTETEAYVTGAANDKGLFYGSTSNGNTVVKVFGIENFWACKWHRTAGLIGNSSGGYSYKMTASTADGSSVSGYNSNGNGYLTTTFNSPTNNYVTLMEFGAHGALPLDTTGATSTTYYCDYFYNGTGFALVGGYSNREAYCGFYVDLRFVFGYRYWGFAAALSCKPLAQKG